MDGRAPRPLTPSVSKRHVHEVFSFFHWLFGRADLCMDR